MTERKLILIAEDDPDDRLMLHEAFQDNNVREEIVFFTNGEELHRYLNHSKMTGTPVLIMLDLNMPRMDGKTLLREIKSHGYWSQVPVIVLTTSKTQEDKKSIIKLGGADFYTKPSSYQELVGITAAILNKWVDKKCSISDKKL